MKTIVKLLANKAVYAAFAVLGAFAASAELVKTPILNDGVSVGYKVTGLENGEVAMVYTNHLKTATWTVPYDIENVQFLVVGGGGGGGGAASYLPDNSEYQVHHGSRGGAGGGGGGVVTGLVNFVSGDKLSIKIGKGGTGGIYSNSASSGTGAAKADEEATTVKVGGIQYIKAGAGGSDNGYQKTGGQGASNSGSRNNTVSAIKTDVFYVNSQFISIFKTYGHKGGMGNYGATSQSGGGGGGAGGSGKPEAYSQDANASGGNGGKGLELNITGELVVYGAGGGGGSGYKGNGGKGGNGVLNSGAGNGGSKPATTNYSSIKNDGSPALANQGGGGGGAGYRGNGGNGGSGIVVFRYVEKLAPEKPIAANLTYTGSVLVGVSGDGFTVVSGTVAATEVGTYTAVLSPEGGAWADGTEGNYEVTWKILPIMTALDVNENDGYIVRGLGDGNEVAVVFTNENADAINWTVPTALNNAQFLVVGGGGGGGADNSVDSNERIAGAGGGGGGVVTGLVNFDRDAVVSVTVGAGGSGGKCGNDPSGNAGFGGAYNGEESKFCVNDVAWVTAYGGGSDQGADSGNSYLGGKDGSAGGSGGGGRANAKGGAVTQEGGDVNSVNIISHEKHGFPGGDGCTEATAGYGYGAAGGGGGATAAGDDGEKIADYNYKAGNGGAGLTSDITGIATVYGSGGGGSATWGAAGVGGEGAGDGGFASNGKNALANQGGGGGGSSRKAASGGNGGSGIVVFRFEYSPVAAVNGYGYTDIIAAINAANGGTVTLVDDVDSITLNNSLTLKTDVYSVDAVTLANENAVLITDKKLNVVSSVADYDVVESVEDGVYTYSLDVVKQASGELNSFTASKTNGRDGLQLEIARVFARESLIVKVFGSKGDCLTETSYKKSFSIDVRTLTCSIVIAGELSSSWSTEYNAEKLTVDNMPARVELWIDGILVDTLNSGLSESEAQKYRDYDFVKDAEEPDVIVESGTWGGIDWTLSEKGVLTIKPTAGEPTQIANRPKTFVRGEWPEAVRYNTKGEGVEIAGWPYDRSKVKKLVIEEGVTKIGSFTAQGFNNLTGEVVIPWTVTYIGQEAFQRSQFTKLTFGKVPEGKIGEELCIAQGAFKNLEIEEATLPDDRPVHLHAWIFNNCHKLKRVTFPATIKSMHGTNHIDYFKNFESHSNPTWTKSSELLAYDESIEVVTFGSEEVKNMFFNINNGTSKDYIKAVVGLKAYGKLQLAIDAANAGDTIKLIKDITENITVNKPINFTGKTIKGEITIDSESNLIVKRDANGKIIGVVVPEAVMNSVKYAPVQEAIDAAQDGDVITLIADVTLTESLKVDEGKTIILDLNGHNITMDESLAATGYAIENSGTLTLIDSGMDSGSVQSRGILNNGTLYVENGTYNAVGDGSAIVNNGEAYLTGGTFTAESGYSLNNASGATMSIGSRMRRMFAGVVVANGIYSNGALLINGGEIYDNSGRNAICVDGDNAANSSAVINGGTITGGLSVNEGAGLEIAGGVFNGDKAQNYDIKGNISIKGGAFLDDAAKAFAHDNVTLKDNEVLTVTDEVFANLLRSKKGYYVSQNANYSYSIMLKSSFRLFVTAVEGKPRLGFFQDHATGAKPCTLLGATNLEKPDWTPVAYSEANDASNASDHPLKWVKINETKDSTKVYRFFKIAE